MESSISSSSSRGTAGSWKENSCFTFALNTQRKRKRAKFDPSRKSEVATVRRKGACLRCRLLKASCSEGRPCENCVRAKHSSHVQVHKWMNCVSVSLRDFNIFKKGLGNTEPSSAAAQIRSLEATLQEVPICLCGESQVIWSLDFVSDYVTGWIENRRSLGFSKTGMLASPRLQCLLDPLLGPNVAASLRLLMLSTILVYNVGHGAGLPFVHKRLQEFRLARATSAEKVLRYLEETVTASFLNRPGGDHKRLQALIILAFGVMRSLAYFDDTEIQKQMEVDSGAMNCTNNAENMRDQLACALGHFLVLLIEKLGSACLKTKLPVILKQMQKHKATPFICALPIASSRPLPISPDLSSTPMNSAPDALNEDISSSNLPPFERLDSAFHLPTDFGTENDLDLQGILTNDLEALGGRASWNTDPTKQYDSIPGSFRQCLLCSSPLCLDEPDVLCIACQQPPEELWPGKKPTLPSNESSPITLESSRGRMTGFNSLSTSMTSQDSALFDEIMSVREYAWGGGCGRRRLLPPPVEEEEENEDEAGMIFAAEDMDFGPDGSVLVGEIEVEAEKVVVEAERVDEFPPGWSLYWEDSSDEQDWRECE